GRRPCDGAGRAGDGVVSRAGGRGRGGGWGDRRGGGATLVPPGRPGRAGAGGEAGAAGAAVGAAAPGDGRGAPGRRPAGARRDPRARRAREEERVPVVSGKRGQSPIRIRGRAVTLR